MAKLIFLALILGQYIVSRVNGAEQWLHAIRELDDIHYSQDWDEDGFSVLPHTPQAIYHRWCRPLLRDTMEIIELIEKIFPDNIILHIMLRIGEISRLDMTVKFCNNHDLVVKVAQFNKYIKPIIPDMLEWDRLARDSYLAVADPRSHITASQLICLQKRLAVRLMEELPPKVARILEIFFAHMEKLKSQLIIDILVHLKIDFDDDSCRIPNYIVPNHLGIRSTKTAFILAWDRVLMKKTEYMLMHENY